jgi:hypothetical protein
MKSPYCAECLRPESEHTEKKCLYSPTKFTPIRCSRCWVRVLYFSTSPIGRERVQFQKERGEPQYCERCWK